MESLRGTPLYRYGYGAVLFYIVFSFVIGLIFAPFSWGFSFFLFVWLLWFIAYSMIVQWQYPNWRLLTVIGVFCAGLTGFIIGRFLIDDHKPFKLFFDRHDL